MHTTIHVTLADCPRDVLIHLVDHPDWQPLDALAVIAPADAGTYGQILSSIRRALALLDTMGLAQLDRHRGDGLFARATPDGVALVEAARRARAGMTWATGS